MALHVAALFRTDEHGALISANDRAGNPAPRFFWGRTSSGPVLRFRVDVDPDLARRLRTLVADAATPSAWEQAESDVLEILAETGPIDFVWRGPCFAFPPSPPEAPSAALVREDDADVLSRCLGDWIDDVGVADPIAVAFEGASAVAVCCSVRKASGVHEAGVETHPDFRQRGHGSAVTLRWAAEVRRQGAIPLYSTSWQNEASQALARRIGLLQYGHTFHVR